MTPERSVEQHEHYLVSEEFKETAHHLVPEGLLEWHVYQGRFGKSITQMWGVVFMKDLPYLFKMHKSYRDPETHEVKVGRQSLKVTTAWLPKQFYHPLDTKNQPRPMYIARPIADADKQVILRRLGTEADETGDALDLLYNEKLISLSDEYISLGQKIKADPEIKRLHQLYVGAVCQEKEKELIQKVNKTVISI